MQRSHTLACLLVVACALAGPPAVAQVATVELTAGDPWAGQTDITVSQGTTVPLVLSITEPVDLAEWQIGLTLVGDASELSVLADSSWWESEPNTYVNMLSRVDDPSVPDGVQDYVLVGSAESLGAPWSHSAPGTVSLATVEFTCQGPDDVVVSLALGYDPLTMPYFGKADEAAGPDFNDPYLEVEFSNVEVTVEQVTESEWDFSAAVAAGEELFGEVDAPAPGTYDDGTLMDVLARATDPIYVFSHWEETTGSGVPGGDPTQASLVFGLHSDVDLVAHFAMIPEPLSLTVFGLGLTWLGLRRRRGRRA